MERGEPRGDEVACRPSSPCADLKAAPTREQESVAVKDRGFVLVDEADLRVPAIGVPIVIDAPSEIRPCQRVFVADDHVGEQRVEIRQFQIFGHVVGRHDENLVRSRGGAERRDDRRPPTRGRCATCIKFLVSWPSFLFSALETKGAATRRRSRPRSRRRPPPFANPLRRSRSRQFDDARRGIYASARRRRRPARTTSETNVG